MNSIIKCFLRVPQLQVGLDREKIRSSAAPQKDKSLKDNWLNSYFEAFIYFLGEKIVKGEMITE